MNNMISPSILNADIANLANELRSLSDADMVHVDVMDGHFVPNLSWGLPVLEAVLGCTNVPTDTHLMIENPDLWAPKYAAAGSSSVTFHLEAAAAPVRLAREIRGLGAKAGIALKPATDITGIMPFLADFDMVLVMTVEPGFGGQKFLPETMTKISTLRSVIKARGLSTQIQVDGGINRETIIEAAKAGASNFVVGSALMGVENRPAEIKVLKELANQAGNGILDSASGSV